MGNHTKRWMQRVVVAMTYDGLLRLQPSTTDYIQRDELVAAKMEQVYEVVMEE